jgi:hypothetical protein
MKADSVPKKTSMTRNPQLPPMSRGHRHLPLHLNPSSPFPKGLILRYPMRPLPSVPASHAALHTSSKALTRARRPRTQLPGIHRRVPCQYRVISQGASIFLVLSRLPTPTLRGGVVLAVLETRPPRSGAMYPLPLGKVPIPPSYLRRLRARSALLNALKPLAYRRAWPSPK